MIRYGSLAFNYVITEPLLEFHYQQGVIAYNPYMDGCANEGDDKYVYSRKITTSKFDS